MQVRHSTAAVMYAGMLLLATACAGDDLGSAPEGDASGSGDKGSVRIASQSFPEAALVTAMYDELLTEAGYETDVKLVDTRDAYLGIFPSQIDVVPEYVGAYATALNAVQNGDDAEPFTQGDGEELAEAAQPLFEEAGVTLLDVSEAADTNAFFVTQEYADAEGVATLSDMEGKSVVLAAAKDCEGRLDCEGGLSDQYGIDVTKVLELGYGEAPVFEAVLSDEAQMGETASTDGTLESQGLVLLEDDQQIQPAQNLVPAVSTEFLDANPDIADILNPLMAALTTEKLTELNGRVSVDREQPEDVARDFLVSEGLLEE